MGTAAAMYLFFTDETNVDPHQGKFFIYGGLILTPEQLGQAHGAVEEVRRRYGYLDTDSFKFQTASRPKQLTVEEFTAAKAEVVAAANRLGIRMIIYVVLHDIAKNQPTETNIEWALNSVLADFDMRFLSDHNSYGTVCIDRLPEKFSYDYLKSKFQGGVTLPDGRNPRLSRIVHYSVSSDGASHVSSLVDIALGGVRYCVNAAGGIGKEPIAKAMFPNLAQMLWHKTTAEGTRQVGGYGFIQYPKNIKVPQYATMYQELATTLGEWGSAP